MNVSTKNKRIILHFYLGLPQRTLRVYDLVASSETLLTALGFTAQRKLEGAASSAVKKKTPQLHQVH
jgi:hypothetical protein